MHTYVIGGNLPVFVWARISRIQNRLLRSLGTVGDMRSPSSFQLGHTPGAGFSRAENRSKRNIEKLIPITYVDIEQLFPDVEHRYFFFSLSFDQCARNV